MKRFRIIALYLLLPPAAAVWGPPLYRELIYPNRFSVVEEGTIYRGGDPTASHIRRISENFHIRTVVSLTDHTADQDRLDAVRAIDQLHLRHIRVPMPGDGVCDWSQWEQAAAAVAEESNWPVYFHCAAGKQRSNAVLATYRLKFCGWSLQETLDELIAVHGLDPVEEQKLFDHIRGYARQLNAEPRPSGQPPHGTK